MALNLATLNGRNGFRLDGGASVSSAGDVNGDGFDDLIVGKSGAAPDGKSSAGSSYVVFGGDSALVPSFDLRTLDGSNGFRLDGTTARDWSGRSTSSAGDVNGDGFDDVIIGAFGADPGGNSYAGSSYVFFGGGAGFAPILSFSALDGTNGFRLDGVAAFDYSGHTVSSAGDVNGDGFDDLIIGAVKFDPGGVVDAGSSYVVFGSSADFAPIFDLSTLNGTNGFRLDGVAVHDYSGGSVSSAGDVNGDGFDDLVIGAFYADPNGNRSAGSSYVVFGNDTGFDSAFNLSSLNGINGFRVDGVAAYQHSGSTVSAAGDINGDGISDLIIGTSGGRHSATRGSSFVIFGKNSGFDSAIDLSALNGTNGFRLDGAAVGKFSSVPVSSAGDVNGDGFDDLIVGGGRANPNGFKDAGSSYLVYGGHNVGTSGVFDLGSLRQDGTLGSIFDGVSSGDYSGGSVSSAGDVNGDGFDDLVIGAFGADPNGNGNGNGNGGSSYVVFGGVGFAETFASTAGSDAINGGAGLDTVSYENALTGVRADLAYYRQNQGEATGDTYIDIENLRGSSNNDVLLGDGAANGLEGLNGNDRLFGRGGSDVLNGGLGRDWLDGGAGVDVSSYENATSGMRADLSHYGQNQGEARGDTFVDLENLRGSSNNDVLLGNDTANGLEGLDGNDRLFGRGGSDALSGGIGADRLGGGFGGAVASDGAADFFVYSSIIESTVNLLGRDTIIDFWRADGDKIDLSAIDADINTVGIDDAFNFISNVGFSIVAGQLRYDASFNLVQGDVDGDGAADFAIKMDSVSDMMGSDFVL